MLASRAYRLVNGASGSQRVTKPARLALRRTIRKGFREGLIAHRNELGNLDFDSLVIRKTNTPSIVVRPRGDREFDEIPPSEIARLMQRMKKNNPLLSGPSLYRQVLVFYETKRMTSKVISRMKWIEEYLTQLDGVGRT